MTPLQAVVEALKAGADVQRPLSHPFRLADGPWLEVVDQDVALTLLTADPSAVDTALSWWVGHVEYMTHYRRALAADDGAGMAWWRQRFAEDYQYLGPFPETAT